MFQRRRTPLEVYEGILKTLNAKRLELIRHDLELISNGWKIYFAIDPHDISNFCFPFSPEDLTKSQLTSYKVEEISKLQNGRFEAMYNLSTRPILLEPYVEELDAIRNWARWSKFVTTDTEIIDNYIALLSIPQERRSKEVKQTLNTLTDNNINSLIAVVTGIVSIGTARLNDVLSTRLLRGSPEGSSGKDSLKLEPRDQLQNLVFKILENYFYDTIGVIKSETRASSEKWLQRSRHIIQLNNQRDAKAIDHLIQLNEIYNEKKYLILYLSSSPKSLNIFTDAELKSLCPLINGSHYDLIRTPMDMFVYMVYKGDSGNHHEKVSAALKRLEAVGQLIEGIETVRDKFKVASADCLHCNEDFSQPTCQYGAYCDGVIEIGKHIETRQETNMTLSLQKRLAKILERPHGSARETKYGYILHTLSDILSEAGKVTARGQEMETVLRGSLTKANFLSAFVIPKRKEKHIPVSCDLNYYPVRLRLKNPQLAGLVKNVIDLLPIDKWTPEAFEQYVGDYLKLDSQWNESYESELVRCLLYLLMRETNRARKISNRYLDATKNAERGIRQEFRYLQCFVLRQAKEFPRAIEISIQGTKNDEEDGRFYHCRSMLIYTIRKSTASEDYSWKNAADDALKAVEKFSRVQDFAMMGVNYNNLAYFYSSRNCMMVDIEIAKGCLGKLIECVPEQDWDPEYPEYFHTKGCVLFAEYLASTKKEANKTLLFEAHKYASKAFELFKEQEEHVDLKEITEKHIKMLDEQEE